MDNYVETLDALMKEKKEKKKKESTRDEKRAFHNAWMSLAIESGFSGYAEQFLYGGFSFCGAKPFYAYLCQAEDPTSVLDSLFNGKHYGNDSNVTFRLVTHLLALMLSNNTPTNLLVPLITRLPGICINKDKKRLGTAEKTMLKYFFTELNPKAELPPLADIGVKPVFAKEFATFISSVINDIENKSAQKGVISKNIKRVRQWIAPYEDLQRDAPKNSTATISPMPVTTGKGTDSTCKAIQVKPDSAESPQPSDALSINPSEKGKPDDMMMYLSNLVGEMGKVLSVIRLESTRQKKQQMN